jgi:hypothetical protein
MFARAGWRRYVGPERRLSSNRSMAANACPDVSDPGGKARLAGRLSESRHVRKTARVVSEICGSRRRERVTMGIVDSWPKTLIYIGLTSGVSSPPTAKVRDFISSSEERVQGDPRRPGGLPHSSSTSRQGALSGPLPGMIGTRQMPLRPWTTGVHPIGALRKDTIRCVKR